jgi:phosphoglycolate phosphatase-like HAD superfamily hydrolase
MASLGFSRPQHWKAESMKRLVLFDIDGTLLTTHGRAVAAMMAAYRHVFGRDASKYDYRMDGKTELQITHELMALAGLTRDEVTARLPVFWPHYAQELERHVSSRTITVHQGVADVVRALAADSDTVLGLLTGNCQAGAETKLRCAGLEGFVIGAYGERYERREDLPLVAVDAAEQRTGRRFHGKEIVILGDTPSDIACGRSLGVKSIAVATGRFTVDELQRYNPDVVFPTFSEVPAVLDAICA